MLNKWLKARVDTLEVWPRAQHPAKETPASFTPLYRDPRATLGTAEMTTISHDTMRSRSVSIIQANINKEEEEVHAVTEGHADEEDVKPKRGRRAAPTRESKDAHLAERAKKDQEWLQAFDPQSAWLPSATSSASYTTEFCKELERRYWRNCGFGKPPWYGADMQGAFALLSSAF